MLLKLAGEFETASRRYAASNSLERDPDWFILKLQEELGELTQVWNKMTGRGRKRELTESDLKQALADETADLLGHVLLFANHHQIDLASAIERKWRFKPTDE